MDLTRLMAQEHGRFVLFRGDCVADVRETDGLGEFASELKKPIRSETADGDGVLHGLGKDEALLAPARGMRHP